MASAGRVLTAFALLSACDGGVAQGRRGEAMGVSEQQRATAALRRIGLDAPASARVAFVDEDRGMDDAVRVLLVMPAADWAAMKGRAPLAGLDAKLSPDDAFHLGGDEGAWRPDAEPGLIAAQLPWRDGREALNVGEAVAGPGQVRVYLFWHQL